MAKVTIPIPTDLNIEKFSGASITQMSSFIENGVIENYPEGKLYVTQRPSFTTVEDASEVPVDGTGRGIYYWRLVPSLYLVNLDTVYSGDYSTACTAASDTVTSITRSGATATITVTNHGYIVGQSVTIAGAVAAEYNGTFSIVATPTANTFTITVSGTPADENPAVSVTATPSFVTGSNRVYWAELADDLFLLDVENNIAWYIDDGSPTVLNIVRDANFPDDNNNRTLADGCAVLDGTLYVLANVDANTNAEIWGSDLNDMTSWSGTNFVTASKNSDRGVYIGKHHSNIFVLGNESTEFFYNAGNPTGSPLNARQDLSYNIGCADGKSVFVDNDVVYFVGKSTTSGLGVYKLENFQLSKISTPTLDSYLNTIVAIENMSVLGSGVFIGGKLFYILTVYTTSSNVITAHETIVYNSSSNTWTFWEHASPDIQQFPLVQWVVANDVTGSNITTGKGILSTGDYLESYDDFYPQDRIRGSTYVATDYVESGYISDIAGSGDQITLKVRIGHLDFDTRAKKFMHSLRPVCDETDSSQTLYVKYTDSGHDEDFTLPRSIDLGNDNDKLTRLGHFRNRTFQLEYSGDEAVRLQGLEVEVVPATH